MTLDRQVSEALTAGASAVVDSDDFFARVQMSIAEDRLLQQQRRGRIAVVLCILGAILSIAFEPSTPPNALGDRMSAVSARMSKSPWCTRRVSRK